MLIDQVSPQTTTVLEERGQVVPAPRTHYVYHDFPVPVGATRVRAALRYRKQAGSQLFIALFDPDGFRGNTMRPSAQGDTELAIVVGENNASPGAIPGAITAGQWCVQIDIERIAAHIDYLLTVEVSFGPSQTITTRSYPEGYVSRAQPGWYRGELHCHSTESDGSAPVETVVRAARELGLDFLALTDHFTISGQRTLADLHSRELALLRSTELTGHSGHANLHGLRRWHDVYVDGRDEWDINQLALTVRDEGGLFGINHPFSAELGWRYHELNWGLVDLLEVYHANEGPGNLLALGLWDDLLRRGYRIVGVAATDSHDPYKGRHRLGQLVTTVYAEELSEQGIIAGLRTGRVYGSKGPRLEFWGGSASEPGRTAPMGATVAPGEITFTADVRDLNYPCCLHVIKNGFNFALFDQPTPDDAVFRFGDTASAGDYYRLELHALPFQNDAPERRWRCWETLLAFSNPIFVG